MIVRIYEFSFYLGLAIGFLAGLAIGELLGRYIEAHKEKIPTWLGGTKK